MNTGIKKIIYAQSYVNDNLGWLEEQGAEAAIYESLTDAIDDYIQLLDEVKGLLDYAIPVLDEAARYALDQADDKPAPAPKQLRQLAGRLDIILDDARDIKGMVDEVME